VLVGTRHAINGYDAELHYMDSQIERIFSLLEESGEAKNTIIVVTADHGEGLGQHDAIGHGGLVWQEQLHVPLIIFSPNHEPRRIAAPAWTPDIFPTVLGMVELPDEASWLKQVSGGDMLAGKGASPFAECMEGRRTLIEQDWKYQTWEEGNELLFNLQDDPYELDDLASSQTDQLMSMRAKYQERQDYLVQRSIALDSGAKEMMPEEEVELLRQLGYLDDEHLPER
jgi:arylsulfatase A-like enzyme